MLFGRLLASQRGLFTQTFEALQNYDVYPKEGETCISFACPTQRSVTNTSKIFVNKVTKNFVCHACGASGDFSTLCNILKAASGHDSHLCQSTAGKLDDTSVLERSKPIGVLTKDELYKLRMRFKLPTNLQTTTLSNMGVHMSVNQKELFLPYHSPFLRGARVLTDQDTGGEETRSSIKLSGVFGYNILKREKASKRKFRECIIVADERDAMAVYSGTKVPTFCLPQGSIALSPDILPMLEQFEKISLWFPSNNISWASARQFAIKLGDKRTFLVPPNAAYSSPVEAAQHGRDLSKLLHQRVAAAHDNVVDFTSLRDSVYAELSQADTLSGVPWTKFTGLNDILKGHRRGELTIITGRTGTGKTTFMADSSLDLCRSGVATLWGSFEIPAIRLAKTLLTQFVGKNLANSLDEFDDAARRFEELPLHYLTFHGSEDMNKILEAMYYACYVHDISHIILDNLQFMMDVGADNRFMDRFHKQDGIVSQLRRFATEHNCHVSLVVHPRKEPDEYSLSSASIFGGVKVVQEADNVLLLQVKGDNKFIEVAKNRYDGQHGKMFIQFQRDSTSFLQVPPPTDLDESRDTQGAKRNNGNGRQKNNESVVAVPPARSGNPHGPYDAPS